MNKLWVAFKVCVSEYFVFSGRLRRPRYVNFGIMCLIIFAITKGIDMLAFDDFSHRFSDIAAIRFFSPLLSISILALLCPMLGAITRRLHDMGQSGLWLLSLVFPPIGIPIILFLTSRRTQPFDNNWGHYYINAKEESLRNQGYNPFDGHGIHPQEETNEHLFDNEEPQQSREGHL